MSASYTAIARTLHWLVAGLIVSQYVIAELAEQAAHSNSAVQQLGLLANHKSVGMTIFGLAILRILWRLFNRPPVLPSTMSIWQTRASSTVHVVLYGFLLAMPLTGWLMSSASAYSVSWFNVFVFPDLIVADEANAQWLENIHEWLAEALFIMALLHIVAALKHHYLDKDDVLNRMASRVGWLLFVATVVLVIGMFGRVSVSQNSPVTPTNSHTNQASLSRSDLPIWNIDYEDSFIEFSGDQAGAPFSGRWQQWQASMQFEAAQLSAGRFEVLIQSASVFSDDKARDDYIRDPDFFDVTNFPEAVFTAQKFTQTEPGGFTANAQLTIKNISHPVQLNFTITKEQDRTILDGEALLDRFLWNIGMGDWADTSWVGQEVAVKVRVVAKR